MPGDRGRADSHLLIRHSGRHGHTGAKGFAPIAIGLALTLIHLVSIPVTNTSVNPARSIGPALFAGGDAMAQLWLFILAPVVGALFAGLTYGRLFGDVAESAPLQEATSG